jgi:hypothetical protein
MKSRIFMPTKRKKRMPFEKLNELIWNDKNAYLLLVCMIIGAFYIIKPTFIEGDSYYYLLVARGLWESTAGALTPVFQALSTIPEWEIKAVLVFLMFIGMLAVSKAGEVLFGPRGWLCGLFLLLNPVFVFESLKFENEQFVYPFLMIGFFLSVYAIHKKKYWLLLIPAAIVVKSFELWIGMFHGIPWFSELEYIPLTIMFSLLAASIGLLGYFYERKLWIFAVPALLSYILCLFLPKLAFFSAPFLAIGFFPVYEKLKLKLLDKHFISEEQIAVFFVIVAVLIGVSLQLQPITEEQQEIVKVGIETAKQSGLELRNDWDWGYLVAWNGGIQTRYGGGGGWQDFNHSIAITNYVLDCELLKKSGEMKLYKCV